MVSDAFPVVVENLHMAYRRGASVTPVLQGVDLSVAQGECVFLVGPSGSGKTTLLSVLGCILSPDRGRVEVLGHDIGRLGLSARATLRRRHLGFLFQRFHLIRGLTALENVMVPLTLQQVDARTARRRAAEVLDQVGLADRQQFDPLRLSVGQCQRVALARALAAEPDLILADEPTAALDAANGAAIMKLLRKLTAEQGKTAIVVTHDSRILSFADRVLSLEGGQIGPGMAA